MMVIDQKLKRRASVGSPIQVAVIGAGEMAVGLVNQIVRYTPGMRVAGIFNRSASRVFNAYACAGIDSVESASCGAQVDDFIRSGRAVVAESPDALLESDLVDVVVEMTGTIHYAFDVILKAFSAGKHVVTFNAELDATIGPYLQQEARKCGVRYTLGDGDQPGVTMNLYRKVRGMGFEPLVCGNIKGMLDHYRTPETQKGFAEQSGQNIHMVTRFADGTKVSLEQACIANATAMQVACRGMLSIESEQHVDTLTGRYDVDQLIELGGIVEMVVGAQPGPGVFVFAKTDDPLSQRYLDYGKLGQGPLYSFYVPYHLLFFELPFSIVRLVDFADGTLDALDRFYVEVVTIAKRDLKAGEVLDMMGGYTYFGECENRAAVLKNGLLPIGMADGKRLVHDVVKGAAITWGDVAVAETDALEAAYRTFQ